MATEEVKTMAGCWYTISCTDAATVTELVEGVTVPLAELTKAGVVGFRVTQAKVSVTTNGKYVILPTEAPAAYAFGGGGSTITLDAAPTSGSANGVTSGGVYDADLHVSLGKGSMAVGKDAVANNAYSVAMGEGAVTGGYYSANSPTATLSTVSTNTTGTSIGSYPCFSTAVGFHATCRRGAGVAFGAYATASGSSATASGYQAKASGSGATASGYQAKASGSGATASGYYATASGYYATASGSYATASGSHATASGSYATASGSCSTACGSYATASGSCSTASGSSATASGSGATGIGAGCYVADDGVVALNAGGEADVEGNTYSEGCSSQLYFIGAGTELADTYTDGEAGLGYVVLDHLAGEIVARGCCKLSAICTDHTTDFSPKNVMNIGTY